MHAGISLAFKPGMTNISQVKNTFQSIDFFHIGT
jgi:hypothetical protein